MNFYFKSIVPLFIAFLLPGPVFTQGRRNDTPENQAARLLIKRAEAASNFAVTDMKITVAFTVTHQSGNLETGTFISETLQGSGRTDLRESDYREGTIQFDDKNAVIGPYNNPPERIKKVRPILKDMAHVKVGAFYSQDIFGSVRETQVGGRAAECVSFDRNVPDFHSDGSPLMASGEICFDRDSGVVLRKTINGETWTFSNYGVFAGKLLAHTVVFDVPRQYHVEGTLEFAGLTAADAGDFVPPSDAVIVFAHLPQ